jgi:hypothetical protein
MMGTELVGTAGHSVHMILYGRVRALGLPMPEITEQAAAVDGGIALRLQSNALGPAATELYR